MCQWTNIGYIYLVKRAEISRTLLYETTRNFQSNRSQNTEATSLKLNNYGNVLKPIGSKFKDITPLNIFGY